MVLLETIILPRQARDKHRENSKRDAFSAGTPYTLNVSLDPTVPNNASAATFAFTITNEKSKTIIDVGKILTTNPSGTHGIPADKYVCNQMPVGGGSFQEYYDGGNFTNVAAISGPIFRGVEGYTKGDVQPTAMTDCTFFGNCSGGYGGCHNETTTHCVPKDGCTSGYSGLATQTFHGGAATFFAPFYTKNRICQDRLGTNIGNAEKRRRLCRGGSRGCERMDPALVQLGAGRQCRQLRRP